MVADRELIYLIWFQSLRLHQETSTVYTIYTHPTKTKEQWQSPRMVGNMLIMPTVCFPRLKVCWSENFDLRVFETLIDGSKYAWTLPIFEFPRAQGQGFFFSKCYISHHQTKAGDQVTRFWAATRCPHFGASWRSQAIFVTRSPRTCTACLFLEG